MTVSLLWLVQPAWAQTQMPPQMAEPAIESLGLTRQLNLKPAVASRFHYSLAQGRPSFPQMYIYVKGQPPQENGHTKDMTMGLVAFKHLESVTLQGAVSYDRFRHHLLKTMTEGQDFRTITSMGGLNFQLNSRSALSLSLTVNRAQGAQTTSTGQVGLLHRWSDHWASRLGLAVLQSGGLSSMVSVSLVGDIDL